MRSALHCGSKQQKRSLEKITLLLLVRVSYIWVLFFTYILFMVNHTFKASSNILVYRFYRKKLNAFSESSYAYYCIALSNSFISVFIISKCSVSNIHCNSCRSYCRDRCCFRFHLCCIKLTIVIYPKLNLWCQADFYGRFSWHLRYEFNFQLFYWNIKF